MSDYSVDVGYSLDLSLIRKGVEEFDKLSDKVGEVSKKIDGISGVAKNMVSSLSNVSNVINTTFKSANGIGDAVANVAKNVDKIESSSNKSSKAKKAKSDIEAISNASKSATEKIENMITKFNLMYEELSKGSKRSEAAVLSTIRMLGATEDQIVRMTTSLTNVSSLLKDPFDDSLGAIRALTREFEQLSTRTNLAKEGIIATKSQMAAFSKIPNEIKAKLEVGGISTDSVEGAKLFSEMVSSSQRDAIDLIVKTNELIKLEKERNEQTKINEGLNKTRIKRELEIINLVNLYNKSKEEQYANEMKLMSEFYRKREELEKSIKSNSVITPNREKDLIKSVSDYNKSKEEQYSNDMKSMREYYREIERLDSVRRDNELSNYNNFIKFKNEERKRDEDYYNRQMSEMRSFYKEQERESNRNTDIEAKNLAKLKMNREKDLIKSVNDYKKAKEEQYSAEMSLMREFYRKREELEKSIKSNSVITPNREKDLIKSVSDYKKAKEEQYATEMKLMREYYRKIERLDSVRRDNELSNYNNFIKFKNEERKREENEYKKQMSDMQSFYKEQERESKRAEESAKRIAKSIEERKLLLEKEVMLIKEGVPLDEVKLRAKHSILGIDKSITDELVKQIKIDKDLNKQLTDSHAVKNKLLNDELNKMLLIYNESRNGLSVKEATLKVDRAKNDETDDENRKLQYRITRQKESLRLVEQYENLVNSSNRRIDENKIMKQYNVSRSNAGMLVDIKATGDIDLFNKSLKAAQSEMKSTENRTKGLATVIRGLLPAIGAATLLAVASQTVRKSIELADSYRLLEQRVKMTTSVTSDYMTVVKELEHISARNGVALGDTVKVYTRLVPAMESFKLQFKGISDYSQAALRVTNAFSSSLKLSNTTTHEASSAMLQFSQAMQSGKLAGDEFRAITEAAPALLNAIAEGSGYARSELKALSSEGKLTTEFISNALLAVEKDLQNKAAKIPLSIGQSFENFVSKWMIASGELNKSTGVIDYIINSITKMGILLDDITKGFSIVGTDVKKFNEEIKYTGMTLSDLVKAGVWSVGSMAAVGYAAKMLATKDLATLRAAIIGVMTANNSMILSLLKNPFTLIAVGVAAAVGYMTFKYNEHRSQIENSIAAQKKFNETIRITKDSIDLLSNSIPKLNKSWEDLSKNTPTVSDAINKMFSPENFDFRLLTDEQRRNLKEQSDLVIKAYSDIEYYKGVQQGKGYSTEERANATVNIRRLRDQIELYSKLQDSMFDSYILNAKLDKAKGASEGYNMEMSKMNKEIESYTKVNALIREGLSLKEAQNRVNMMISWNESNPVPTQKEWQNPEQFSAEMNVYNERRNAAEQDILNKTKILGNLQKEQEKLTEKSKKQSGGNGGGSGKSDAEKFSDEIKQLEKLIEFTKKYGDVERARKAIMGTSVADYDRFVQLTKELENTKREFEVDKEIAATSKMNELRKIGYADEQAALMVKLQNNEITQSLYDKEMNLLRLKSQKDNPSSAIDELNKQIDLMSKGYSLEQQTTLEKYKQFYLLQGLNQEDAMSNAENDLEVFVKKNEELEKLKETMTFVDEILKKQQGYQVNPFSDLLNMDFSQFGEIGNVFGGVVDSISKMTEEMLKYQDAITAVSNSEEKVNVLKKLAIQAELKGIGSVLGATKGFFNEKSKAYKAITAAEKTYKAFELASTIMNSKAKMVAMLQEGLEFGKLIAMKIAGLFLGTTADTASTATEVTNATIRAQAKGTESVINAGKDLPEPLSFAAMAAMAAAIAALGVSIGGSSGGGSSVPSKASLRGQGFGTSLGVKDKASESIVNSISSLENIQDKHLHISSLMLNQLVMIKDGIAGFTSSIFQFTQLTGAKVKSIKIPEFNLNNLGNVEVSSKAGGERTSFQFNQVFGQFLTSTITDIVGVINNASVLTGNAAIGLENSIIEIPKIYAKGLKKLKGTELTDRLTAIIGLIGDTITQQAFSTEKMFVVTKKFNDSVYGMLDAGTYITETQYNALSERMKRNVVISYSTILDGFQIAGEGLLETLTRVSSGVDEANYELKLLGIQAIKYTDIINKQGDVGAEIIKQSILLSNSEQGIKDVISTLVGGVDDIVSTFKSLNEVTNGLIAAGLSASNIGFDIINGAGGIDILQEGLDSFFEDMLNPIEKYNELFRRTQSEFTKLGLSIPATVTAFKEMVGGVELSGNKTQLGALLSLTDDWWNLVQAQEEALSYSGKSLTDAEDLLRQVYEDEKDKLENLIKTFSDIATELKKYRESLAMTNGMLSPEQKLLLTQSTYRTNLDKAMTGDSEALKAITTTSKEYLDAAKDYFASGSQYFDVFNEVNSGLMNAEYLANNTSSMYSSQLDALKQLVGGYIDISENTTTIQDAIAQFLYAQSVSANPTVNQQSNVSMNNGMSVIPITNVTTPNVASPVIVVSNNNNSVILSGVEQRIDTTNEHAAALVVVQQEANMRILERLNEIEDKLTIIENAARLEMVK